MVGNQVSDRRSATIFSVLGWALVGVVILWGYWSTLREISQKWQREPQYSHGYLVPLFALALLWLRWRSFDRQGVRGSWWGLPILAAAGGLRLAAAYYGFDWPDAVSLLPTLAGACVLWGGWRALQWSWPAIAFLVFMIPLPFRLEIAMGAPLQRLATLASTFMLQTLGQPALAEGNTIIINEIRLGVVEACSGLRMLVVFFALATAVALVVSKPFWEKALIVISAVPIAIFTNVIRITATGLLHEYVGTEIANAVFHDLAGWLMMPFALGLLWLELWVIARLLIDEGGQGGPVAVNWMQQA